MAILSQLIPLAINISIFAMVFALGAKTKSSDVAYLLSRPGLLVRSVLSMNIVMVLIAAAAAAAFDLPRAIEVAMIAIAISPVPPILPSKQVKAGGSQSYAISLLVAASLASIALAPVSIWTMGYLFHREAAVGFEKISFVILISIIVPLCLGIALSAFKPAIAARFAAPLSRAGTILLLLAVLPVLFLATSTIWELVGDGVFAVLVAFSVIGLWVGHFLGGPDPQNRTVLALATSTRHPGVAMAIAGTNAPTEKAMLAVILYHLVIGAIVAVPYIRMRLGSLREQRG